MRHRSLVARCPQLPTLSSSGHGPDEKDIEVAHGNNCASGAPHAGQRMSWKTDAFHEESYAQANAACKEHAGNMGAVVVVWYNEENIMRAFWEWVSMKTLRCT